jgi:hypothetical protein
VPSAVFVARYNRNLWPEGWFRYHTGYVIVWCACAWCVGVCMFVRVCMNVYPCVFVSVNVVRDVVCVIALLC